MTNAIDFHPWVKYGLEPTQAEKIAGDLSSLLETHSPLETWVKTIEDILKPHHPFSLKKEIHTLIFKNWDQETKGPPPAWTPTPKEIKKTNLHHLMTEKGIETYRDLHRWSVDHREDFWNTIIRKLEIPFKKTASQIVDLSTGTETPNWLPGAELNISESCFQSDPESTAIVFQKEGGPIEKMTYGQLEALTNQVANGLKKAGFQKGDRIAIDMTMTIESVAIYLGVIKAGCAAISIADSFAPDEIATRLRIGGAKAIFTQDSILRGGKKLPLFDKVTRANAPRAIVLPCEGDLSIELREGDLHWDEFLSDQTEFEAVPCSPEDVTNILFSSGTTGDPKAIPWTHLTPIKSAADGYLHHDIQPGDVVAWPTNLGWMMGPWLIYASLMNRGSVALHYGMPTTREFGEFVQNAKVNMLGLVPSVVKAWKNSDCMNGLDWSSIKAFSSTGECSNADDYFFLMSLAHFRPVIEYCGGTEIGGGYITGTLVQPASPATFSTPSLGLDVEILDEEGAQAETGELYIVPPSIGLSNTLLNRNHHEVYYENTPKRSDGTLFRRHGDQMERLPNGYYRAHGRADDTMNLGGIKVSSAEIERVVNRLDSVVETAAIAVPPPGGGPSELVIYTVLEPGKKVESEVLRTEMQKCIKTKLNPLFKLQAVQITDKLPRTASNKVMRRMLRAEYQNK